jgi:hypothetical protein
VNSSEISKIPQASMMDSGETYASDDDHPYHLPPGYHYPDNLPEGHPGHYYPELPPYPVTIP